MSERRPRLRFATFFRRCVAMGYLFLAVTAGFAQTTDPVPTSTNAPVPTSTNAVPAEPALPIDPTSPSTVGTSTAPGMSLIPAQPLFPPDPFPPRPAGATSAGSVGTLPGGPGGPATQSVTALPAPAPADATSVATNDIGAARRFQYNISLTLGGTYDSNIFLERFDTRSDFYFTIQPTLALGFGGGKAGGDNATVVRFSYSPQALLYVSHPELDTVQHFIDLTGSHRFSRLTLSGAAGVQILDSTDVGNPHPYNPSTAGSGTTATGGDNGSPIVNTPGSNVNLDVGQRVRENVYSAGLQSNYAYSDKVAYDLSGALSINDYAGNLLSTRTISGSAFFDYSPTGKTTVGLGGSVGYVFSDGANPDQSFEQFNVRLNYLPGQKLSAAGQLGLEFRQAGHGTAVTPVFNLSVQYAPFDGTTLALTASRQVQTSAVEGGENYTGTSLEFTVNQRFFQRFYLHLNAGYTNTDYTSQVSGASTGRNDNYFFLQPGLDFKVHENIFVGAFFSYRNSDSSLNNRDFTDEQIGLRVSISY